MQDLKLFLRYFKKNTFINLTAILSFSVAIYFLYVASTALLIAYRSDGERPMADRVYQIQMESKLGGKFGEWTQSINGPLLPLINQRKQALGIEKAFHVRNNYYQVMAPEKYQFTNGIAVDDAAFEAFSFKAIDGSVIEKFDMPNGIWISEKIANAVFADQDPVGQTITLGFQTQKEMTVLGVFKDFNGSSHFRFDFLSRLGGTLEDKNDPLFTSWSRRGMVATYVIAPKDHDPEVLEKNIADTLPALLPENMREEAPAFRLQRLKGFLWQPQTLMSFFYGTGYDKEIIFSVFFVALALYIMAAVNFINVVMINGVERQKEFLIKRIHGANRLSITLKLMVGNSFQMMLALGFAFVLSDFMQDKVALVFSSPVPFLDEKLVDFYILFIAAKLLIMIVAAAYPVISLMGGGLSGKLQLLQGSLTNKGQGIRKLLITFQIGTSVAMVIATLIIYKQVDYLVHLDRGFKQDGLVHIQLPSAGWRDNTDNKIQVAKQELLKIPEITAVSTSRNSPAAGYYAMTYSFKDTITGKNINMFFNDIDTDFLPLMDMRFLAGRNFTDADKTITSKNEKTGKNKTIKPMIINDAARRHLGYATPEELVGKTIVSDTKSGVTEYRVVGILADLKTENDGGIQQPAMYLHNSQKHLMLNVAYSSSTMKETITQMIDTISEITGKQDIDYFFADEAYDKRFRSQIALANLMTVIGVASVLVGMAGLHAFISFAVNSRQREIVLRKILGAKPKDIMGTLVKSLAIPVGIGLIIGFLGGYQWGVDWQQTYAERYSITLWVPIQVVVAVAILAAIAIFSQIKRALSLRPATVLSAE